MNAKARAELLEQITTAIHSVVGPVEVRSESFMKRDLNVQSLDLIEILFQLKRAIARDTWAAAVLAAQRDPSMNSDVQIACLIDVLLESN